MRRVKGAFTIVELIVVITVIGIMATIGTMAYLRYQASARDNERAAKTTVLVESLEKYYDENGEYPSCSAVTQSATTVAGGVLKDIETQTLSTPTGTGNSLQCTDMADTSQGDYYAYVGDGSAECVDPGGTACVIYEIKYLEESTDSVVTLTSRRSTGLSAGDTPAMTATAASFTQINTNWTPIPGVVSYDVEYTTDPNFGGTPTQVSVTSPSRSFTGLTIATDYYFRVRAVSAAGPGAWSDVVNTPTWRLDPPSTPSTSIASSTSINVSWNSVSHATSYTLQRATDSGFTANLASLNTSTTSTTQTGLTAGTTYYFRVQATNSTYSSAWSPTKSQVSGLLAPTGLSASSSSSTSIDVSWNGVSGAQDYRLDYSTSSTFASGVSTVTVSGTDRTITGLTAGQTYYLRVRGRVGTYEGPNSNTISPSTTISTPGAPTISVSTTSITASWGSVSGAVSYNIQYDDNSGFSSPASTTSTSTSKSIGSLVPGNKYWVRIQAVGATETSSWSSSGNGTTNISAPSATSSAGTGSMTIDWASISGATKYTVQYDSDGSSFPSPASTTTTGTYKTVTGLTQGKTYWMRVQANGSDKNSSWSNTVSRTTGISTPSAPSVSAAYTSTTRNIDSGDIRWIPAESGSTWYPPGGSGNWLTTELSISSSCPSGTTKQYYVYYRLNNLHSYGTRGWSTYSLWWGIRNTWDGTDSGVRYAAKVRCAGSNATSPESGVSYACAWLYSSQAYRGCGSPR